MIDRVSSNDSILADDMLTSIADPGAKFLCLTKTCVSQLSTEDFHQSDKSVALPSASSTRKKSGTEKEPERLKSMILHPLNDIWPLSVSLAEVGTSFEPIDQTSGATITGQKLRESVCGDSNEVQEKQGPNVQEVSDTAIVKKI